MTRARAEELLRETGLEPEVVAHCRAVSRLARAVAGALARRGHALDLELVELGGLLHDIGRSRTHGVGHAVAGRDLLDGEDPVLARLVLVHIGAGIGRSEAASLGLPPGDYIPRTLEERVVAFADNLVFGTRVGTPGEAEERFERELGAGHPAARRVRRLNAWMLAALGPERPWEGEAGGAESRGQG